MNASVKPRRKWRRMLYGLGIALAILSVLGVVGWWMMIRMPGKSYEGELPELASSGIKLQAELEAHVVRLADEIGPRSTDTYPGLQQTKAFLEDELTSYGYELARQDYDVDGLKCTNLEVELLGSSQRDEIVIVGAHYDTVGDSRTPGANDNASGVAAVLALAKRFVEKSPEKTLRFVCFTNEEPPYFQQKGKMGSWVYAQRCRERHENLIAVISIETIGYYKSVPNSQEYPPPFAAFYPSQGDFIAVIGNVGSRHLVRRCVAAFRAHESFPSEGGAVPGMIKGVGWSDHWAFWQAGYPAVMFTDTAPFRYPYYHRPQDTPDKLDFDHMARVVHGIENVIAELSGVSQE